jgi:aminopeptidase N
MLKQLFTLFVFLFTATSIYARGGNGMLCSKNTPSGGVEATGIVTTEENWYDVKHLKFDIALTNTGTAISGSVTTTAVTTVSSFGIYAFELDTVIVIDSVKFNGVLLPVTTTGFSTRKVTLPTSLPLGSLFTTQVFYHGQPPAGTGQFFTRGMNHYKRSTGTNIMYTLSDPDLTKDWWPCKQSLQDKIDSVDMWITVADSLKAGCNGLLKKVTPMPGNKLRFEWKTNYPIDYYLIAAHVAPYKEYNYYMHFTDGSNDSMLVQNFVFDSATWMTASKKAVLDSTGYTIDYFSTIFGKYPFYKEKYGHCIVEPLGGGMENQTMTALGNINITTAAHELGHQWWGNHVTYGTWADIWLSEGFATYCEQLFIEKFWGSTAMQQYRTGVSNSAMSNNTSSVYVDDTNSSSRIFDGALTYAKGASVAHMLRYMAPQDSLFFRVLKNYQQQFAFGHAVTADLHNIAEQVYGIDLDSFFRQWVHGIGVPTYKVKWYQEGTQVYLQVEQTTSKPTSVPLFWMPVQLKLTSSGGDTTVTVFSNTALQTFPFYWNRNMTGLQIDPNDHILNKTAVGGGITKDPSVLKLANLSLPEIIIYPNPATDEWYLKNLPANTSLVLKDVSGKILWKSSADAEIQVPAKQLPNGVYFLSVSTSRMTPRYYKLLK